MPTVSLPTGVAVPYAEHGDPDGLPVVLLHGYSDSHRSFEPLLAELPRELRAFALTTRGHGDADRPEHGYDSSRLAADVAAFLDAVRVDAAVVVGHSAGTYTARRLAIDHPDRTAALVLIGAIRWPTEHAVLQGLRAPVAELEDPVDAAFVRAFQESTPARPVPPAFLDLAVAESRKLPARVWRAALDGMSEGEAPTSAGTIEAPTLLLWGERDEICPREDQDLLAATIGAELTVYPGGGHAPHWERPAQVAADVAAFSLRAARRPRSGAAR